MPHFQGKNGTFARQIGINEARSTTKQKPQRSLDLKGKQKIKTKSGKIKKLDTSMCNQIIDPYTYINPDHCAMIRGKMFDVDKQIDEHKRIDPKDVFENYKDMGKAPEKNKKKIRKMEKSTNMKVGGKNVTIKMGF